MDEFIGRTKELSHLQKLLEKNRASFVVIKGRRRIGKSRLAQEFGKSFPKLYAFAGLAPHQKITASDQKKEFIRQMREYKIPSLKGEDWGDLFWDLAQKCKKGPCLIILDEISWMGQGEATFLSKLKNTWDLHFKKNPQLVLIVSGSQSTWIEKNILNHTGFVGRLSLKLSLEEMSLSECSQFWHSQKNKVSNYEKLKILAVTGGVPRYLEEILIKKSAEDNIKRLCFEPDGLLFHEFDQIFSDLFSKRAKRYKSIVRHLAQGKSSLKQISESLGRDSKGGGDISEGLEDLCQTGFVSRDYTWSLKSGKSSKLSQYRLSDNYLRFYLKYIEGQKEKISSGLSGSLPASWLTSLGLQFENLVLSPKNRLLIYEQLGLNQGDIVCSNPYFQTSTKEHPACQIDWLIQDQFNTLYLCEIKFKKTEIDASVIKEVQDKINKLKVPRYYSIRPILIHANGAGDAALDFFAQTVDVSSFL